jgi:hypothetical protein
VSKDDRPLQERVGEALVRTVASARAWLARLLKPGSVVVLLVVTATGVGVVLREADLPDPGYWRSRGPAAIVLAIVAACSYIGYCLVVLGYRRSLKGSDQNTRLYTTCRDVASLVERNTKLTRDNIGVHVWTIRGMRGFRRLERRVKFVSVDRPATPITWCKGKGVLGQVWARDEWILADLEVLANAASEEEFYKIPRADRFNFTWNNAKATQHYKAALVWPLHGGPPSARKVIGCLSVDAQTAGAVKELDELWTRKKRMDLLAHIAVCEGILEKG